MDKFKFILKRYKLFLLLLSVNIIIAVFNPVIGKKSMEITFNNIIGMLSVVPPIFVLIGLMDIWVKRETMIKYMGEGSGIIGILLAFLIGSAAAGPLFAAFPVAGMLLRKGSKLSNVFIMLGAWSTTKIPLLLFEAASMGVKFTIIRFISDILGIVVIAYFTEKSLNNNEKEEIYNNALKEQ